MFSVRSISQFSNLYCKTKTIRIKGWRCYSESVELTSIHFENGMKTITMRDRKTRNSLSLAMMDNLFQNIVKDASNPSLRAIVLAAEGPVFSAGHNLKELDPENESNIQEKVFSGASRLMSSIIDSPVPVIAKVDGLAAAAGCQLVAQCDMAVCTESSTFSTPGANFGIFCSTPGIPLARCVPKNVAMKMLLTGQPITSVEAKLYGLVTEVCEPDAIDEQINAFYEAIKGKSRSVVQLGKQFYYRQVHYDIKKAYKLGEQVMIENLHLKDAQEGIRSFKEKRKPIWSHN